MSKQSRQTITVGADPEFFIMDAASGVPRPICGMLGGTKDVPTPMAGLPKGFFFQEDNVMAEFNIPPAKDVSRFYENIVTGRDFVINVLRGKGYSVAAYPGCEYAFPTITLAPYPKAFEFGCSPDFDGYNVGQPAKPANPENLQRGSTHLRFAGGHIHLGYESDIPPFIMAQLCDLELGLRSVGNDTQSERRALYGNPGRFRPTAYGIEYRTLSNFWLFNTGGLQNLWVGISYLETFVNKSISEVQALYKRIAWKDVQTAINENNVQLARDLTSYVHDEVLHH